MDVRKILKLFNSGDVYEVGSPLGASMVAQEIDQMIARGMGRRVSVGAFSTGVAGGAAAVIDIDQPQLAVSVPSGYTIRPLRISVQVQTGLAASDNDENEIVAAVDPYGRWTGDGTFTVETPINMRTDLGQGSGCLVGSAFSADMTTTPAGGAAADPVLDMELDGAHQTVEIVLATGGETTLLKELKLLYAPTWPEFIVGPATLLVYWGGTVEPLGGFCQAAWLEGQNSDFYVRT